MLVHKRGRRKVRDPDLFDRRSRVTQRLRCWGEALCQLLPIAHVARLTGLRWHTIKQIDLRRLERLHGEFVAGDVRRLVMDEFALHKGHRYATVVMDTERMKVLWVGEGNSRESLRLFFGLLGPERCARIEALAMDMNTAFDLEVQRHCP